MQMQMNEDKLYYYKGTVQSVYDGDTIRVDIDLGLNVVVKNEAVGVKQNKCAGSKGGRAGKGPCGAVLAAKRY